MKIPPDVGLVQAQIVATLPHNLVDNGGYEKICLRPPGLLQMAKGETVNDASGKIVTPRMVFEGAEMMIEIVTGPETGIAGLTIVMMESLLVGTGHALHEGYDRDRDLVTRTSPAIFLLIADRGLAHPALTDMTSGEDAIDLS